MGLVSMLIVGLIAGALAKLIIPGRQGGGVFVTILLGIAGSLIAGLLGRAVGWYRSPDAGPGIIASTVGAIVLLLVYGAVTRRRGAMPH
jgi:uncharacterized membrane protein YeaQ/YmgE (transglycosylase-associated protein family)